MIEWTSKLSTGMPVLDEQHQTIFRWPGEFQSATADERALFEIYAITRLKHNLREHFAAKKAAMKTAGCPELDAYRAAHAEFRARLGDTHLKLIGESISSDTVNVLAEWLIRHIVNMDMAYVPYLKH